MMVYYVYTRADLRANEDSNNRAGTIRKSSIWM